MSDSVRPHRRQPTRLPRPWDSPGKSPGVGCHFLLQGSSPPTDQTRVSCIVGRRFTVWATRGVLAWGQVWVRDGWRSENKSKADRKGLGRRQCLKFHASLPGWKLHTLIQKLGILYFPSRSWCKEYPKQLLSDSHLNANESLVWKISSKNQNLLSKWKI